MPMDIRNFFSKVPSTKSKSKSSNNNTTANSASTAAKTTSSSSSNVAAKSTDSKKKSSVTTTKTKTTVTSSFNDKPNKKNSAVKEENDAKYSSPPLKRKHRSNNDNNDDKNSNNENETQSSTKKQKSSTTSNSSTKQNVNRFDDSDTDIEMEDSTKSTTTTRRPVINSSSQRPKRSSTITNRQTITIAESDSDTDVGEDFEKDNKADRYSTRSSRSPKRQEKEQPKMSATTTTKRRNITVEESDDDDNEFLNDEDYTDLQQTKTSANKKSKTTTTPTKKKQPSTTPSATPPASSRKKKATSPPTKPPQRNILKPTREVDTINVDSMTQTAPECLQGLTFVFTGVLDHLHRDEAIDMVKMLGGRVTTAVSGRTTYLVAGVELEDGRPYTEGSKYKNAIAKNVIVVRGTKKFYGLVQSYHDEVAVSATSDEAIIAPTATSSSSTAKNVNAATSSNPYAKKPTAVNPYAKKPVSNPYAAAASNKTTNPYATAATRANPYASKSSGGAATAAATTKPSSRPSNDSDSLWVDKHAPQHSRDILGNKENINKLVSWLNTWERTFNNSNAAGKAFSNPRGPWRAALLSGPPGIGKTTTATLVAQENGRELLEFNASDTRSKKSIQNDWGDVTGSQTLNFTAVEKNSGNNKMKNQHQPKGLRCIIMDEVDGMGAGDRGGMAELIQLIKKTKVPIICICNDRQSQKIKSLLPYCLDLRFRRPTKSVMATRALRIAQEEGLHVERNAAEAIAESCGNDVRQVLNCLQMWSSKSGNLTYRNLKERERTVNKDEILRISLFDAAKLILEGRRNLSGADSKTQVDSLFKRSDAYFVDYSFVGLIVQQNYPRVLQGQYNEMKRNPNSITEEDFFNRMHNAAHSMSDFAVVEPTIQRDQNWSLLPFSSMLAVQTGYHAGGESGGFLSQFPEFTSWMGKNSTRSKKLRLLQEIHFHMNYKISGDCLELRQSYIPLLRRRFMDHLTSTTTTNNNNNPKRESGTEAAIVLMDDYGLSREDIMEKLDEFKLVKDEPLFGDLDSKLKSAFTREYNQGSHTSQALVAEQQGGKKPAKRGKQEATTMELDAINDDEPQHQQEDDDEEEVDDEEEMKKIQASFKAKGKKGRSSTASSTRKRK